MTKYNRHPPKGGGLPELVIICVILAIALTLILPHVGHGAISCHYRDGGALPSRTCTPGAVNPVVTQRTIKQTICKAGWASSVRPPVTTTEPQKFEMMRAYGVPTTPGHAGLYEFDHLIPLELGGAPDNLKNLWPEPHDLTVNGKQVGSYAKDAVEDYLNAQVCQGKLSLAAARTVMRTQDWIAWLR